MPWPQPPAPVAAATRRRPRARRPRLPTAAETGRDSAAAARNAGAGSRRRGPSSDGRPFFDSAADLAAEFRGVLLAVPPLRVLYRGLLDLLGRIGADDHRAVAAKLAAVDELAGHECSSRSDAEFRRSRLEHPTPAALSSALIRVRSRRPGAARGQAGPAVARLAGRRQRRRTAGSAPRARPRASGRWPALPAGWRWRR